MSTTKHTPPRMLHERMIDHIMAGGQVKYFALDNSISVASAQGILNKAGIKKYWLTPAEYKRVMDDRRRARMPIENAA